MKYRIKTTIISTGKEFLGPFVYSEKLIKEKIERIKSWHDPSDKRVTIESIAAPKYPRIAKYPDDGHLPYLFDTWVEGCELAWERRQR